jgi:hypothetical protein
MGPEGLYIMVYPCVSGIEEINRGSGEIVDPSNILAWLLSGTESVLFWMQAVSIGRENNCGEFETGVSNSRLVPGKVRLGDRI